jgi:hypothetical protein
MRRRKEMIRNKHQIGKKANLKSLKRYCREIWLEYIKQRDGNKCVICGKESRLNSHHIITAKCSKTRFEIDCGITLCALHHQLGISSAHGSPWVIYEWLEKNRPEQNKWFLDNRNKIYEQPEKKDIIYYQNELKKLLDIFERDYPQVLKRSKYFTFTEDEEKEIINFYIDGKLKPSLITTALKFDCGEGTIKSVLKRNNIKIRKNPKKELTEEQRDEKRKKLKEIYKNYKPWNKGLTKETDERVKRASEIGKETYINNPELIEIRRKAIYKNSKMIKNGR